MGANATKFEGELAPSEPEILGEVIFSTNMRYSWGVITRHSVNGEFRLLSNPEELQSGDLPGMRVSIKFSSHSVGFHYIIELSAPIVRGSISDELSVELSQAKAFLTGAQPQIGSLELDEVNDLLKHWGTSHSPKPYSIRFINPAATRELLERIRGEKPFDTLPSGFHVKSSPNLNLSNVSIVNADVWVSRDGWPKLVWTESRTLYICLITTETVIETRQRTEKDNTAEKPFFLVVLKSIKFFQGHSGPAGEPSCPDDVGLQNLEELILEYTSAYDRDKCVALLKRAKNHVGTAGAPSGPPKPYGIQAATTSSYPTAVTEEPPPYSEQALSSANTDLHSLLKSMHERDPSRNYLQLYDALVEEEITVDLIHRGDIALLREAGLKIGIIAKMREFLDEQGA